ncbi:hypothetical protein IFM89_021079 [Coptis chinensis]|uniref:DUF4283 domain-containing protein n=1 Tax=Coptis chinensis TaxID=261450 RepID=A0A835HWE3_9MAGN|nr:hypothetical protein IFM89_021079 [Coptis chinensis]
MDSSISSFPPLSSHPTPLPQQMLHHLSHLSPRFATFLTGIPPDCFGLPTASSWSSLFLQNRASALKKTLKHFTLQEVNGVTQVPMDLIMQECNEWSDYVVGFFIEQRLSFPYVKNVLQQRWKDKGSFEIIADKDLFYFKFSSNEARQAVLEEGPIFIGGHCFIISSWTRGVEKQRAMVTTILVWVKCHNVPKELWTDDGLGFVASKVGIPFRHDEATKQKKRIDYARLCIEVNVSANLPDSFTVELALGDERIISFEYH